MIQLLQKRSLRNTVYLVIFAMIQFSHFFRSFLNHKIFNTHILYPVLFALRYFLNCKNWVTQNNHYTLPPFSQILWVTREKYPGNTIFHTFHNLAMVISANRLLWYASSPKRGSVLEILYTTDFNCNCGF